MKRVVAAVDGSEASERAVELAVELAVKFDAELILIGVVQPGFARPEALAEYMRLHDTTRASLAHFAESFARDTVERARAQALARGAGSVRSEVRFGDPAEEIMKCRDETEADAIVIGSPGHGRVAGFLLGSVSQKIASIAPCHVVIAR